MKPQSELTAHARQRSAERVIPHIIAEMILDYGESFDAGDGARKYVLSRHSIREIRREGGREISAIAQRYRSRNAYVVAIGGRIVTVAYASYSVLH